MPSYVRGKWVRKISDAEIYRLYVDDQMDSDSIGALAGCSSSTVLSIVRQAGGIIRPPGGKRRNPTFLIDVPEIIRRYRNGENGPQLAHAAGTSTGTIYRLLRNNGVEVRMSPSARLRSRPLVRAARDG